MFILGAVVGILVLWLLLTLYRWGFETGQKIVKKRKEVKKDDTRRSKSRRVTRS